MTRASRSVPIAFVFPPGVRSTGFEHHLGLGYVQALLAARGIRSLQLVLADGPRTLRECATGLLSTGACLFGFSCYDTNFHLVRILAALIKRERPETTIIVGGPSATFSDDVIFEHSPDVDVAVRFEGEVTTCELVEHFLNRRGPAGLHDILGITFRDGRDIVRTPDRPLMGSDSSTPENALDVLPSPYLTGLMNGLGSAGIVTARGCPHKCTYCTFAAMARRTVRYHSVDRVLAELELIAYARQRHGAAGRTLLPVQFQDDAFSINVRRAKDICRRIIEAGIHLELSALCRADHVDEELVVLMKAAGFQEVNFGLESAVPRVLRNIKKVHRRPASTHAEDYAPEERFLAKVAEAIRLAKKHGMRTMTSIILGLPGESRADGLRTIEFVRELDVDHYAHNYLAVHKGTEIFQSAARHGIGVLPTPIGLPLKTAHAYPVRGLPILENADIFRDDEPFARATLRFLAGIGSAPSPAGSGVTYALLQMGRVDTIRRAAAWVAQNLSVNGYVIAVNTAGQSHDRLKQQTRECFAECGVPTLKACFLRSREGAHGERVYDLDPDLRPFGECLRFHLIRPAQWEDWRREADDTARALPVFVLRDLGDISALGALVRHLDHPTDIKPPLEGAFLDGCRWGRAMCPAARFQKAVLDATGQLRPCLSGRPLGDSTCGVAELRVAAGRLHDDAVMRRNCATCQVASDCARCLYPDPFTEQEYCRIRREQPWLSKVVVTSNLQIALTV